MVKNYEMFKYINSQIQIKNNLGLSCLLMKLQLIFLNVAKVCENEHSKL